MSDFLYHEACDDCGSQDNRAVFSDGHKWCFGCSTFTPPSRKQLLDNFEKGEKEKTQLTTNGRYSSLPHDFSYTIPDAGLKWLAKYGITDKERASNYIGWSWEGYKVPLVDQIDGREFTYGHHPVPLLIFPFYGEPGIMTGWQARTMDGSTHQRQEKLKIPKYLTYTQNGHKPFYPNATDNHSVVLVEDVISAIKVSRQCSTMPLLGNNIHKLKLAQLGKFYKRLVIWLDPDMAKKPIEIERDATPFFDQVEVVATSKDPKEYEDLEIIKHVYQI